MANDDELFSSVLSAPCGAHGTRYRFELFCSKELDEREISVSAMRHSRRSHPQDALGEPTSAPLLPKTSQKKLPLVAGGIGMGSMVMLTVGFVLGIATGYGIREIMSRRRRGLAKRGAIRKKYPI